MRPLHMTNDFNKSKGEGFCLEGESDRHLTLLMRDFNPPCIQNLKSKIAGVTNREFLQSRRMGLVTVGERATDFVGLGELNQEKRLILISL